jgi:DNA processing protein
MNPRLAYIALNMMEQIGPVKVRALIEVLGSPEAIFQAGYDELIRVPGIGKELAARLCSAGERPDAEREEKRAGKMGIRIVTFIDDEYPVALKEIYDPPLALYVKGTLEERDRHAVAIVGSRRTTHYGKQVADRLAYQLGKVGFSVISGLARGIDTTAHEGAIKGGGRTIAVIGSALDKLYPPENRDLAGKITEHGAVMSEFPLGTEPGKTTFPMRNRIVAGLSMGVVVVEAGRNSGALITCNQAMEQGRLVFAVPGRIDSPASKGCHDLIKQGARLVDDVDDILEEFEFLIPPERKAQAETLNSRPEVKLSDAEQRMVKALWEGPLDVDSLARKTALPIADISTHLISLEMKRVTRMLPGRVVELSGEVKSGT